MPKNRRGSPRWMLIDRPGLGARVIGHVRVSTGMQAEKYSLAEQKRKIEDLCAYEGWIIVGWCIEVGVSGKHDFDSRPE